MRVLLRKFFRELDKTKQLQRNDWKFLGAEKVRFHILFCVIKIRRWKSFLVKSKTLWMRSWRDVCWADVQASYLTTTGGILEIYLRRYFDTQLQLNFYLSVCITHRLLIKTILPKHHLRASTPPDLCTMDRGVQNEFVMHSLRKY